jgi:hypothetical protein
VLGPEPRLVRKDWEARRLADGLVLSSCPTLPVEDTEDGLVLGIAIRPGRSRTGWSGRWVFVDGDLRLELDAGGMLGCFYRRIDGDLWLSSSAAILAFLGPALPPPAPALDPDDWTRDWYPPPRSGFEAVRKLLPSQRLDLGSGTVEARRLVPGRHPRPVAEIVDELADRLVELVTETARRFPELFVQLSGGIDSRLVLAATHAAGVRFTAYTNDKPDAISKPDRTLPPRLARALGVEHRLIEPRPSDQRRLALFDLHTAGHTFETDRRYVACRQWDQIPPSALVLTGNNWEVGRGAYFDLFDASLPPGDSELGIFLAEWLEWVRATPDPTLDWRDRLRIEQNVAGWLSSLEQGVDISGRQRIALATCEDVFSLLLSLPEDVRRSGSHQLALIERLAPELAGVPINAPDSALRAAVRRVRSRSPRE